MRETFDVDGATEALYHAFYGGPDDESGLWSVRYVPDTLSTQPVEYSHKANGPALFNGGTVYANIWGNALLPFRVTHPDSVSLSDLRARAVDALQTTEERIATAGVLTDRGDMTQGDYNNCIRIAMLHDKYGWPWGSIKAIR